MTQPHRAGPDRQIKAIETFYNGYHFRSRLEARWAVFLDTLDIGFRYEMEGYDLDGLPYLPDFYLPHLDAFVEIKPSLIVTNSQDDKKATALAEATGKCVYVLQGSCWFPFEPDGYEGSVYWPGCWDSTQAWCECQACGFCSIQFEGRAHRSRCECWGREYDRGHNTDSPRLSAAYHAARAMRFEFRR